MEWEWLAEFLKGMVKPTAATAVLLLAALLSYFQKLKLEGEMVYAVVRAFVQLSVIGFVLQFIFNQNNGWWIILPYLFMVETALALGATPRQATLHQVKRSLVIALSPVIDNTKTVGLISLPGAMTGLIMGGASPEEAIQLQIVVMNMLIGASTLSSIMSTYFCWPNFFTKAYQLKTKVFSTE